MTEQNYTCWLHGLHEEDGREVLAKNQREAARMLVDIWRHENQKELHREKILVNVRDEDGKTILVEVFDGPSEEARA